MSDSKRFNLHVVRSYVVDGTAKKEYIRVGVAWLKELPSGEQVIDLQVTEGIAVTGALVCFEPKQRTERKADERLPRGAR